MNRYFIISIFIVAMLFKYLNIVSIPLILFLFAMLGLFIWNLKLVRPQLAAKHRMILITMGTVYILSAIAFVLSGGPAEQILKTTNAIFVVFVVGASIYYFLIKSEQRLKPFRNFLWEVYILSLFNFALLNIYV